MVDAVPFEPRPRLIVRGRGGARLLITANRRDL